MIATLLDDPLVEHRACENCQMPVNDQGMSVSDGAGARGWIHTLTGAYRCPPGIYMDAGKGLAFAMPAPGLVTNALQGDEDYLAEKTDEAHADGRKEMRDELEQALTAAISRTESGVHRSPRGMTVDRLLDALHEAWKDCPA